ncbi:MAG: hypothetical protein L0Y72_22575 [Gemmataceae bacterium]|nr:hypothetical protein [Gemmataceae bacterium]MCI0741829.1 hypothetical protein [Gemmataceae bacterium]
MEFRWSEWNLDHAGRHGVDPEEAELVIRNATPPYPTEREDEKWLVIGRGNGGRWLQVIFVLDEDDTMYVIHARPLTDKEKKRYRKRERK